MESTEEYQLDVNVTIRKVTNYPEALSTNFSGRVAAKDFMAAIKVLAEFEALTERLKDG